MFMERTKQQQKYSDFQIMGDSVLAALRHTAMWDSGPPTLLSIVLAVVLGGVLLIGVKRLWSLFSESGASKPNHGSSLPKGSLGWPFIGESLAFARDPGAFAKSHVKRYGNVFKSSLFFRRIILGTTPEFARFVVTNSKLFRHAYPEPMAKILGPRSLAVLNGPPHMFLRKIVLKSIGSEALKSQVHNFETIILENLALWERNGTVIGLEATQRLSWDASNWVLFRDRNRTSTPEGIKNFRNWQQLLRMISSIPVNLPGTTYSTGMKARTALMAHYKNLTEQTKSQSTTEGAFFRALLAARDDPEGREELKELDDDTLAENIFLLSYVSYDTDSTTLVWILKFLIDYPDVFRRIQAEQQEILTSKDRSVEGPRLTWEDTRKMDYTQKFLQEVQRYTSLVPINFAEAIEDLTFGSHLIPKGWLVGTLTNVIHSDPANYPDPSFNPDRFDVNPKPFTYIPFGSGSHMCPGIEISKLTGCIFIHHLTTTYILESAAPDMGVEYHGIFPKPRGGLPIKLRLLK